MPGTFLFLGYCFFEIGRPVAQYNPSPGNFQCAAWRPHAGRLWPDFSLDIHQQRCRRSGDVADVSSERSDRFSPNFFRLVIMSTILLWSR